MTLSEIVEILEATVIVQPADLEDINVQSVCSADLMSDVLYYHYADTLLITGLIQINVIRTAEIAGTKAIVFVMNKKPDERTIELAGQKKSPSSALLTVCIPPRGNFIRQACAIPGTLKLCH